MYEIEEKLKEDFSTSFLLPILNEKMPYVRVSLIGFSTSMWLIVTEIKQAFNPQFDKTNWVRSFYNDQIFKETKVEPQEECQGSVFIR